MARNCNCDGVCQCRIVSGGGVNIGGSGTSNDPYVISADPTVPLDAVDTPTVNMELSGDGTTGDPYVLSSEATVSMGDLTDVTAPGPADGDTLVWSVDHWQPQPPSTVPPGSVSTGTGLAGDGSQANPISVRTSGTWGIPPLDTYGTDDTIGAPTYIDSEGNIRTLPQPYEFVVSETDPGNPATNRIWIQPV